MKTRIKYFVERVIKMLLKIFSLFPLQHNRVLFQSFSGRQYSDSPRAVSEYLQQHYLPASSATAEKAAKVANTVLGLDCP